MFLVKKKYCDGTCYICNRNVDVIKYTPNHTLIIIITFVCTIATYNFSVIGAAIYPVLYLLVIKLYADKCSLCNTTAVIVHHRVKAHNDLDEEDLIRRRNKNFFTKLINKLISKFK